MSTRSSQILGITSVAFFVLAACLWTTMHHKPSKSLSQPTVAKPNIKQNRNPGPRTDEEIRITAQAKPCDRTVLTYLDLSRPPSQAELIAAGNLGEPLTPTYSANPTSLTDPVARARQEQDNLQFGTAIQAWNQHRYSEAITLFELHSSGSPDSPWVAESRLHLGCACQYNGRLTEAAEWFDGILSSVDAKTEMYHKAKLRRSILALDQGDLAASLQGFIEMRRDDPDPGHLSYASYWIREIALLKKNETALRDCGQKALARVAEISGATEVAKNLREMTAAGPHGFNAEELHQTALLNGLDSRPVRADTALLELPLPFVAHYQDHHFVTVEHVSSENVTLYDSRLGKATLPVSSFLKQWSGFALIFAPPASTAAIHPAEDLKTIIGGCCGHPRSPSDLGDDGCDKNCGMPGWSVNPVNMNFRVGDTPMWWTPPVGPPVEMSLLFNSLDSLNNYEFFGEKWSFKYSSYLLITPGGQVQVKDGDGRLETFSQGTTAGIFPVTYTPPAGDFRKLTEIADHLYTLTHQDGTVYHYGIPTAMTGNSSVPLLLSIADRHGNSVNIAHNANGAITSVSHSMLPALTPTGGGTPQQRKWELVYEAISLAETVTISGVVMNDSDNDGIGDALVMDEWLVLLDGSGNLVLDSDQHPVKTITRADGGFTFHPVVPGTYQVAAEQSLPWTLLFNMQTTTNPATTVNRVTRIDDPFGRSAGFGYDSAGNLQTQTDMGGLAYSYEYTTKLYQNSIAATEARPPFDPATPELFISKIHTPKGTTSIYTEPSDGITGYPVTNQYPIFYPPLGSAGMWTNYRIRITNPENKIEEYYYDGNSSNVSHRNALQLARSPGQLAYPTSGATTLHKITIIGGAKGKITETSAQAGSIGGVVNRKVYSATQHQATSVEGSDGRKTSYVHYPNGTLKTLIFPKGDPTPAALTTDPYKIHYTYEPNAEDIDTVTRYLNGTLKTLIDNDYWPGTRNLKQTTNALGQIMAYAWHPNGLPLSITDQTTGDIITFIYDQGPDDADSYPTWRLLKLKRNAQILVQTAYDSIGRPQMILDPSGDYSQPIFDNLNRLTRTDYSDSTFAEQIWECCHIGETRTGKVVNNQDRILTRTKVIHDRRGLPIRSIDTAGKITKIGYDDAGQMTTLTDPKNQVTTWVIDLVGRFDKKVYPDNTYEKITWRNMTQPEILRNRRGQLSYPIFDEHGNLKTHTGPAFSYTHLYDPWDRLETLTDNITYQVHTHGYDDLNRSTSLDGPWPDDTLGWQYLDAQRKVIQTRPGGITQTSTNDSLGRSASLVNPLGTFTPGYDGDTSRLLQVIHSGGFDTAFTHYGPERDRALHTITSKLPGGSQIARHTYGYNDQDQINSWKRESYLANPSGLTRSFEWSSYYDFSSQLTSVAEKSLTGVLQGGWDYGHDLAGNITGTQTSTAASNSVALTKRTHNSLNQIATTGGGGSTLIRGTLSEPGQVSVGMTGSGDKPARMLEGNRFETELPLQVGINSVSIAASDFSANRSNYQFNLNVAAQSPTSPSYDNEGNLLSDGTRSYDWDTFSRLKRITWAPGKSTDFIYNTLGQRSERIDTVSGVITKYYYIYDGIQLIERRTGTSATTATADRRYFSQGEQRKNGSNWENYFYCRDHLGSIREVVKSVGSTNTLVARYDYAPYGQRLTQYQAPGYTCDFGYTGHITLPSLVTNQAEMVLTHFRAYDPALMRWLSADPIGEAGGMNLYGYVGGNPINEWDPTGLASWRDHWEALGSWTGDELGESLGLGAMATADGFIPFSDPFQLSGGYSGCEDGVGFSKAAGAISRDAAIMATGLPLAGSKRFVPPGAASGTNAARLVFRRITKFLPHGGRLPKGIPSPIGYPFVNFKWSGTADIAGILGRYWPYYAGGLAAISDAMDLNSSRDCP